MMKPTPKELLKSALDLVEEDDNLGACYLCGHTQDGVEPDAEKYQCEVCGLDGVYGAEQIILMGGVIE